MYSCGSVCFNISLNVSGVVSIFALNSSKTDVSETEIDLLSFENTEMFYRTELFGSDLNAKNSLTLPESVKPVPAKLIESSNGTYHVSLRPASWNVMRFKVHAF